MTEPRRSTGKRAAKPATTKAKLVKDRQRLEPENPIEVAPEGSSEETLDQRRLKELHEAVEEYHWARERFYALYQRAQDLIIKGAIIKQGVYKVDYAVRLVRRPHYKQLLIDAKGEDYQQRCLEATALHAHVRVRVR